MAALDFVPINELRLHPLFEGLPYKFLEFNDRTVVRRRYQAGQVVCRQGEYGTTAFVVIRGQFRVVFEAPAGSVEVKRSSRKLGWLPKFSAQFVPAPAPASRGEITIGPNDLIIGEMTCLSYQPRTATVIANGNDCEMWEIRRNFLDMLRRNKAARQRLEILYKRRAIPQLRKNRLFAELPEPDKTEVINYLLNNVEFIRVDPGRIIFEQGEPADYFYLVRLGFVKVSQRLAGGAERVLDYLGPDSFFGEIGLLTALSVEYLPENVVADGLPPGFAEGTRTATCAALGEVELFRVKSEDFRHLIRTPSFRNEVVSIAQGLLAKTDVKGREASAAGLDDLIEQGLYYANKLLVLDLTKCTRCDECTRACSDTHVGVTRLIREGLRFGSFLVATSCRSCMDPHCLVGCPVDAIHRRPPTDEREGLEILIDATCIGCGLCASNCPYGNITMHPAASPVDAQAKKAVARRAVTCDLCGSILDHNEQEVSCVYACPHDAAHRMSGMDLFQLVHLATNMP